MFEMKLELEPVTLDEIENPDVRSFLTKYENNSTMWKTTMLVFMGGLAATYLLGSFLGKGTEGGFLYTRLGTFLSVVTSLCFLVFVVTLIREHNLKKKHWKCPRCGRKMCCYTKKQSGAMNFTNEETLLKCIEFDYRLAGYKNLPMVIPEKCPSCHARFLTKWVED